MTRISELPDTMSGADAATNDYLVIEDTSAGVTKKMGILGNVPIADAADAGRAGFFKDDDTESRMVRLRDRVFIGDGAKHTGNRQASNGLGASKLTENGANWPEKNAQLSVGSAETGGRIAILGYAAVLPGESSTTPIGVASFLVNKGESSTGRAHYAEAMHGGNAATSVALEIQVGNYSTTAPVANAYAMSNVTTIGAQIGVEAGHNYTTGDSDTAVPTPTHPGGAAIDISGGSIGASYQKWTTGIVFRDGGLVRDGSGFATAISMAKGHEVSWGSSSSLSRQALIRSDVETSGSDVGLIFGDTMARLTGSGERTIIEAKDDITGGGAVNSWRIANSRTGAALSIKAQGSDTDIAASLGTKGIGVLQFLSHDGSGENVRITPPVSAPTDYITLAGSAGGGVVNFGAAGASTNIDIRFATKGPASYVRYGTHAAIGAETVTGFISIRDDSGTVRKLAVVS